MMLKKIFFAIIIACILNDGKGQNYSFNFNTNGRRVCLVNSNVTLSPLSVTINILEASQNSSELTSIYRRSLNGNNWTAMALNLSAGTTSWTDNNVALGDVWEYKVVRNNTWSFMGNNYPAVGYTIGSVFKNEDAYKGQMILLVASDVIANLSTKYTRLKSELVADGWKVNEIIVNRALNWDSGDTVVTIKNQITTIYNGAPTNDKPKCLFILGHVPLPRCGSTLVTAPDEHDENKGARGCDCYYADIDGQFTDTATFNPGNLVTPLAINLPNDYKWDQDFFPSDIELAFGRVDFADLTDGSLTENQYMSNYLDRLSNYRNVTNGFNMGEKSAFHFGFDNSNDGSYRSLPNISKSANVFQNTSNLPHPQWVQNNGPFKIYMQNLLVPDFNEWQQYGMNATVFSSDQSYWGFGDVAQNGSIYSRIRSLLAANTKCLVTLWTTTGINIFHQACTGQPFGLALKEIMNHNTVNQKLEKAPQTYDTEDFWNRTHFAYYGDPTITLYQVTPPTLLSIANNNGSAQLQWTLSADTAVKSYSIYESNSQSGPFIKISNANVVTNNFIIPNYQTGNWYMVRGEKKFESGCGQFVNLSIGSSVQGNLTLNNALILQDVQINVSPNPTNNEVRINSNKSIENIHILSYDGKTVKSIEDIQKSTISIDLQNFNMGVYYLKINGQSYSIVKKIVKTD
jgi:hypothetical protein